LIGWSSDASQEIASVDKSRLGALPVVSQDAWASGQNAQSGRIFDARGPVLRLSGDSFIAERPEQPGRARLRVGCRIGQFELGRWFGRSACALSLMKGTSCSKADRCNRWQRWGQFPRQRGTTLPLRTDPSLIVWVSTQGDAKLKLKAF